MLELGPRLVKITALGLVATGAAYLPPFHAAARADGLLYDLWSRLAMPAAPDDVLVVPLATPSELDALTRLAAEAHASVLVTTFAQPSSAAANDAALGPLDFPLGGGLLQRTTWRRGGHLYFPADADGVVRRDRPLIPVEGITASLALSAVGALDGEPARPKLGTGEVSVAGTAYRVDRGGRRALRFFAPASFASLSPAAVAASPVALRHKIVVAGPDTPSFPTPLGTMSARELLAQAIAGYARDRTVLTGGLDKLGSWLLAAALLAALLTLRARSRRPTRGVVLATTSAALAGALLIVATSAAAFELADHWLPAAGPCTWLVISSFAGVWLGAKPAAAVADPGPSPDVAARGSVPALAAPAPPADGRLPGEPAGAAGPPAARPGEREARPARFGRYEVLDFIGRGAMGEVWLGRDPNINRMVAIKAVDLAEECDPDDLRETRLRFLREAETAGRLNHPNIVTIYDVGESGNIAYIAMEYLHGLRLSECASPETLLPPERVIDLLSRTAEALDYAHRHNVVHRDIKPANIMYDAASNTLKLTDFGIARLIDVGRTRTGIVLGTPSFMSPEQLEGRNVNGHTDLFALGVSLYQLLTGHLPFHGASMTKLMFVIANEPHRPVTTLRRELPPCLDQVLDRALAKDPGSRFGSGAEMAAAMRSAAGQFSA